MGNGQTSVMGTCNSTPAYGSETKFFAPPTAEEISSYVADVKQVFKQKIESPEDRYKVS